MKKIRESKFMKVYTKKGDSGKTSLIGGTRVPKHHIRIEAYGTIDELNSYIGLLRDYPETEQFSDFLKNIQIELFNLGALLASDPGKSKMQLPEIEIGEIERLEKSIDEMDLQLPELKNFVLPGGTLANSTAHVARSICRRAERHIVQLDEYSPVDPLILQYINRLSDWLFVFSRWINFSQNIEEVLWESRK